MSVPVSMDIDTPINGMFLKKQGKYLSGSSKYLILNIPYIAVLS